MAGASAQPSVTQAASTLPRAPEYLPIAFFGLHPLFWADVRVFAAHIDGMHSSPEARDTHFLLGLHPIQKVEVAGVVVGAKLQHGSSKLVLSIDDGTGVVQAAVYQRPSDAGAPAYAPAPGDLVAACGKLAFSWRAGGMNETCREVRVRTVRRLASAGDLAAHWLETTRLHAEHYGRGLREWLAPAAAAEQWLARSEARRAGAGGHAAAAGGSDRGAPLPPAAGAALAGPPPPPPLTGPAAARRLLLAIRRAHPYFVDERGARVSGGGGGGGDDDDVVMHGTGAAAALAGAAGPPPPAPPETMLPLNFTVADAAALLREESPPPVAAATAATRVPAANLSATRALLDVLADAGHVYVCNGGGVADVDGGGGVDARGRAAPSTLYCVVHPHVTLAPIVLAALRGAERRPPPAGPAGAAPGDVGGASLPLRQVLDAVKLHPGLHGVREYAVRVALQGLVAGGRAVEVAHERFALDEVASAGR